MRCVEDLLDEGALVVVAEGYELRLMFGLELPVSLDLLTAVRQQAEREWVHDSPPQFMLSCCYFPLISPSPIRTPRHSYLCPHRTSISDQGAIQGSYHPVRCTGH